MAEETPSSIISRPIESVQNPETRRIIASAKGRVLIKRMRRAGWTVTELRAFRDGINEAVNPDVLVTLLEG